MFEAGATIPTLSPARSAGGLIREGLGVGAMLFDLKRRTLPDRLASQDLAGKRGLPSELSAVLREKLPSPERTLACRQSPPPPQRRNRFPKTRSLPRPARRDGFQFHSVRAPLHIPHSCLGETPVVSRSERLAAARHPEIHLRKSQNLDSPSTLSSQQPGPTSF